MNKTVKKITSYAVLAFFLGFFVSPVSLAAVECDRDGDGYIVIPEAAMKSIGVIYNDNDNLKPVQWENLFEQYKGADLTDAETCEALNFKKGAEPSRCDEPTLSRGGNVYDPSMVDSAPVGNTVNPGAFDQPDNGIDEDCDGEDASLLASGSGTADVGGLVERVITLLSRVVVAVSIIVMIWGGVLYATAAGDEQKTSKARKAIIGAVIGLIVGLLAPTIVNMIASSLA